MIFKTPYISEPIEFEENKIQVLVIENPDVLTGIVSDLLSQKGGSDGDNVFSENYAPLNVKKDIEIITDPFSLDLNSRKLICETAKYLNKIATTEMIEKTNEIRGILDLYADELFQRIELPLQINLDWTIDNIIKSMGMNYGTGGLSLNEKLAEYFKISKYLLDTKCFVLLNIKQYLNKETMGLLYRNIINEKQNVLLIESHNSYLLNPENTVILDKDLCLL